MRLLKLSDKVQQMIIDDMISTGHARALLAIDDPELQYTLANKIFDEKLSVRETEKLVKEIKNPKKPKEKKVMENAFIYQDLEEKMKGVFGTKVSIGIPITAVSSRGLRDFILYQLSSDSTVSSVSGGVYF